MPSLSNIIRLKLPNTTAQAGRMEKRTRRRGTVDIEITIVADRDAFREQRAWRTLFGLFQDCAGIRASKGFKKRPGKAFTGTMEAAFLPLFLREAVPFVAAGRAQVYIDGDRVRPRLLDVMAA